MSQRNKHVLAAAPEGTEPHTLSHGLLGVPPNTWFLWGGGVTGDFTFFLFIFSNIFKYNLCITSRNKVSGINTTKPAINDWLK